MGRKISEIIWRICSGALFVHSVLYDSPRRWDAGEFVRTKHATCVKGWICILDDEHTLRLAGGWPA